MTGDGFLSQASISELQKEAFVHLEPHFLQDLSVKIGPIAIKSSTIYSKQLRGYGHSWGKKNAFFGIFFFLKTGFIIY